MFNHFDHSDDSSVEEGYSEELEEYNSDEDLYKLIDEKIVIKDIGNMIFSYRSSERLITCFICQEIDIDHPINFLPYCRYDSKKSPQLKKICYKCYEEGFYCKKCS